jgi:peptide/nickel transport system ATP-binding protein
LELDDVRTHFRTPRGLARAVDGVSLRVERGATLGVVGESGSGKTVLARTVMGLLPPSVTIRSGTVRFDGHDISTTAAARPHWGSEMAMIFQDPMSSLNPVMRAGRQIGESLQLHRGLSRRDADARAVEALRAVGIPEPERRARQYPHEMSGGMRQRVMIAIALACEPKLVFADEPTTALDVTVQAQILDVLAEQQAAHGMSLLLVTHDLGVVAGRTDEIAVMYAGRVVERATTKELFASMRHPYSAALLASIPKLEDPKHTRLDAIPGRPPDIVAPEPGCAFAPRCSRAQPSCHTAAPALVEGTPGHWWACFFPLAAAGESVEPSPVLAPRRHISDVKVGA